MTTFFHAALGLLGLTAALFQSVPSEPGVQAPRLGHPQSGLFQPQDFTDSATCQMCHPQQYEQWQGGMHSFATVDPYYLRAVKLARADVPGVEQFCSSCHAPAAVLAGQSALDTETLPPEVAQGVACDVCHSVSAQEHLGNFGYILAPGPLKFGPTGAQPSMFHTVEQSPLHHTAQFCGSCHDVTHPLNNLQLESTYSEWAAGPYAAEGVKCQDCHMTSGITYYQATPGSAASGAPEREHVWSHAIVGGNSFVTDMLGSPDKAEAARERLGRAATLSLGGINNAAGRLTFTATVSNSGAGHMLPTGVTEERQIWIEAVVYGVDGSELAHFGQMNERGVIATDTMILQTVFADSAGQATHRIWLAQSVLSDRRIAPRSSDTQEYSITLVPGIKPQRIEARLWYRSSHQDFIDELFADTPERELVPQVLMAETQAVLD